MHPRRILVVDNVDSFVYTIVGYLQQLGAQTDVVRTKVVDPQVAGRYDGVLISPGPGIPQRAGRSMDVIRACAESAVPLLGVCLGHQALGVVFGARVVRAPELRHGKTSTIIHDGTGVLAGLPPEFPATRYHSLVIDPDSVPAELAVNAWTASGVVMGLRHVDLPLHGVQFHPESVLTQGGHHLLATWLEQCGIADALTTAADVAPPPAAVTASVREG